MSTALPATLPPQTSTRCIELRGVRVHNLKGIDLDIPLGQLVVLSGVSGSGKSSLAFDTLFAEGQRRYIESFSASARQYLERIERPNADRIAHVPPAIAIRTVSGHQRSLSRTTVAALAEIDEGLRRLFARVGRVVCPDCRIEVRSHSAEDVVRAARELAEGTRFQICFPAEETDATAGLTAWQARGFSRAIVGGQTRSLDELPSAVGSDTAAGSDNVWLVADRLVAGKATPERMADSAETAFREGAGRCLLLVDVGGSPTTGTSMIDGRAWQVLRFNRRWECGSCRREFLPPDPQLFVSDSGGGCEACREQAREGSAAACPHCLGSRLRSEALAVRVGGDNLAEVVCLSAREAAAKLSDIERRLSEGELARTRLIRDDIGQRLRFVCDLGLGHLTLNRRAATLSGGEARRLMLAAALGSRVTGTLCVIDEPSAGLHSAELPLVVRAIRRLQELRNSVIVVDHAPEIVLAADHVIDLGPGAGPLGGHVVFAGSPRELSLVESSATGRVLRERSGATGERSGATGEGLRSPVLLEDTGGSKQPPVAPDPVAPDAPPGAPDAKRKPSDWLTLTNVRHRHLNGITVRVPLGVLCVVSGPGGCGKTSLVVETLYPALCERLGQLCAVTTRGECESLTGGESLVEAALVDQTPLTRSSRSNAATWIDVFDDIRDVFALTGEAKQRGFGPQHFSFNAAAGGRCRACRGTGVLRHDMQFLPDVSLTCPECHGTRYRREILEVKYRGRTIADVLAMSATEAATFFRNHPKLQGRLHLLKQIGLDYLVLGQPTDTLSGGEAQRLKLASRLTTSRGPTLIVCDEPTVGLHPADVTRLIACFDELLAIGHSLVVIDNSPELRRSADHEISLT